MLRSSEGPQLFFVVSNLPLIGMQVDLGGGHDTFESAVTPVVKNSETES
jgi:hypothetical protein